MSLVNPSTLATKVEITSPTGPTSGIGVALIGQATAANSLPVVLASDQTISARDAGLNTLVDAEKTYTWANSAAAATYQSNTFTPLAVLQGQGLYLIHVRNPSSVTALTLVVYNVESLGGSDRDCELARFSVPASSLRAFLVQGWLLGSGTPKLSVGNDTVLGGSDGFSAQVRVRAV